ncbi:MAG: riboflavin synthase [Desulfobacterales bacterium CG07_land_8_20_14_0_80_52_14]|nr:MAG: riboflavin synthase [Desulfobacterales bacterium CG23_combo_of_CG06-09_8_20_14_all_52_9]PIU49624.1 MAG: riboflavin synthase [Desulfobacterales bacterium CG07_land_8_20_14_0_80_52_14]
MFTGIIEGQGTIAAIQAAEQGRRFVFAVELPLTETRIGDSIAVNGVCLTAVTFSGNRFAADVSPETLEKTTFGKARIGDRVNIERAMRFSDRVGGHLVSGHIDGVGRIRERTRTANAFRVIIQAPEHILEFMVPKGSVAVDGVSLTLNECHPDAFEVSIIPHTAQMTTVGTKKPKDPVNIEADMIGKYIAHFLSRQKLSSGKRAGEGSLLDRAYLEKTGFL